MNMSLCRNERYEWIDILRTFTMVLVIIGHCNYYNIQTSYGGIVYNSGNFENSLIFRILGQIISFIYSFHMPLFMAISGACFSLSKNKKQFKILAKEKARRLLVPFVVVTFFISIPCKLYGGYWAHSNNLIKDILVGQFLLMGNSHLWFVVSLYYIFLSFYVVSKIRDYSNILYWCFLLSLSVIGYHYCNIYSELIGITGMLKHLFFFAIGYHSIQYVEKMNMNVFSTFVSWVLMYVVWKIGLIFITKYNGLIIESLIIINRYIIALWGIYNMVNTALLIHKHTNIHTFTIYNNIKNNSYNLYLFSDPFNYLLIPLLYSFMGDSIFTSNIGSGLSFFVRFFVTIILSYAIIYIMKIIKRCI